MRVLVLALGDSRSPSTRFRLYQYQQQLRTMGIEFTIYPGLAHEIAHATSARARYLYVKEYLARWRQIQASGRFDVVVVQKGVTTMAWQGLASRLLNTAKAVVFDLDDAVHLGLRLAFQKPVLRRLQNENEVEELARGSRCVLAGNRYLAQWAQVHNSRVVVLSTPIDTVEYQPLAGFPKAPPFTLLWSGSQSTNRYLNLIAEPISHVAKRLPVRLRVISNSLDYIDVAAFSPARIEFNTWRRETEVSDLAAAHVGMMPLPDDDWTRGKCGLKALQYMALALPTICSPVGINSEIIRDGQNGFHASTSEEWESRIACILQQRSLAEKLGKAGRDTVEQRYSVLANAPRLAQVLRDCAEAAA